MSMSFFLQSWAIIRLQSKSGRSIFPIIKMLPSGHGPGLCECHAEMRDTDASGVDLLNVINIDEVVWLNEDEDNMGKSILKLREDMLDQTKYL